jgi:hypothetical protein
MKYLALTTLAATLAFAAAPAFADQPTGAQWPWNTNASSNGNLVGVDSSRIIQNGQFVSGSQTTTPGSRAATVQQLLGH